MWTLTCGTRGILVAAHHPMCKSLEALLGVSEDDIVLDYALTSASTSGIRSASDLRVQLCKLDVYPEATPTRS